MKQPSPQFIRLLEAVLILNLLCLAMLGLRLAVTGSLRYNFIPWNLILAWLPLGLSWWFLSRLAKNKALDAKGFIIAVLWLFFLPNTWYVLTDYIHIRPGDSFTQLYDIVLISTLVFSGFTLGFTSLYLMHRESIRRLGSRQAHILIGAAILVSSFAIYLGRDLRWNTWDVLANPADLILDVSDRIGDPLSHPRAVSITALFFILIGVMYTVIYRVISSLNPVTKDAPPAAK